MSNVVLASLTCCEQLQAILFFVVKDFVCLLVRQLRSNEASRQKRNAVLLCDEIAFDRKVMDLPT